MSEQNNPEAIQVIYEDNHYLAAYKLPGMIAQEDITGDTPMGELIKSYLKIKYNKPGNVFVGLCHRLDRPVSGLILFAKTSKGLFRMNDLFKNREIQKTYIAIVREKPPKEEDKLVHWLVKDKDTNVTTAYDKDSKGGLKSELIYKLIAELDGYYVLQINPLTGRSHQIRAQLAKIACPIVGDNKYGYKRGNRDRSICLHAYRLNFIHPIKNEPIQITAEVPEDEFWQKFDGLIKQIIP